MTDDAINAAIAQACGWEHRKGFRWQNPEGLAMYEWDIPNYCTDLNAMHEAEKVLGNRLEVYGELLCKMTVVDQADFPECYIWHVTARQRAEAFLRTLGKWEKKQ